MSAAKKVLRKGSTATLLGKKLSKRDVEALIHKIAKNDPETKSLSIPGYKISNNLLNQMLDAIEVNTELTHIDVSHNGLQDIGVCELFSRLMISNNRSVRTIDVSFNGISAETGKKIHEYLSYHFHIYSIKYNDNIGVTLSESGLTTDSSFDKKAFSDRLIQKIDFQLHSNRQMLLFLNNQTNRFECWRRKVVTLKGILRESWGDRILSLDLTNNKITSLPDFVANYSVLQELLFSHNNFSEFPEFIGQLVNLRVIDFSHNQIEEIPYSVRSLLKLETLIVSHNKIKSLPLLLCTLPKLSFLAVAENPIGEYSDELLKNTITGCAKILNLLKKQLDLYLLDDVVIPESVSDTDRKFIESMRTRKLEYGSDFSVVLPVTNIETEKKDVSRALEPKTERTPTAIQKVGDGIWCGCEDGSIYHWDARNFSLREIKPVVLNGAVLDILEIPQVHEVWVAGSCNYIVALSSARGNTNETQIPLPDELASVQCMIFVSISNRVWAAASNSILSIDVKTKQIVGTINMESPILSFLYLNHSIWAGCGDGCIYIMSKSGKVLKEIQASSSMVFHMCAVGPFIWSSSNEDIIKVWVRPSASDVHCVAAVPVTNTELHKMASSANGEKIYVTSSCEDNFCIFEYSPTGKLLTRFENVHKSNIIAVCWSPSPDRLWTADNKGIVANHELKMGKKTLARLKEQQSTDNISLTSSASNLVLSPRPAVSSSPIPATERLNSWVKVTANEDKERRVFSTRTKSSETKNEEEEEDNE